MKINNKNKNESDLPSLADFLTAYSKAHDAQLQLISALQKAEKILSSEQVYGIVKDFYAGVYKCPPEQQYHPHVDR
jgi:hypothetical protein